MNSFRFIADMCHLLSFFVLYHKIHRTRSCKGISLKTQELYALVFIMRYLDLVTQFVSLYNTCMKLIFLGSTFAIIYQMRYSRTVRGSYEKDRDTFRHEILIGVSIILAFVVHERISERGLIHWFVEVLWHASLYLESVAILPQLTVIMRTQNIDNLTGNYIALLGLYRGFYILNWIYRYMTEDHFVHWLMWLAGLLQTGLYADFFYYYFKSWKANKKLKLPA